MSKTKNNPQKVGRELNEKIIKLYEKYDFPAPLFVVVQSFRHLSGFIQNSYSMQLETLSPMGLAYFATMNDDPHTITALLRLAWMKAWLYKDKECLKILRPYYKLFADHLCKYLKSKPIHGIAVEMLDREPEHGNIYRQAFYRYKSCLEYPELFQMDFIKDMPFNLDWMGAWFCHLVNKRRPELKDQLIEMFFLHPGFAGHLTEISDEYRNAS